MKNLTKSHTKTIDQSNIQLPPCWINNDVSQGIRFNDNNQVFISGKDRSLAIQVNNILKEAKEMVVLSSFLLADQEVENVIEETANRGVRIYLMLASEARLDKEPGEDDFSQMVIKQHKDMLRRLGNKVLIRSAPHYHAKVILSDPFSSNAKGFLLTANLTKEAFERNEELGVKFSNNEIKEAIRYLKWAIWEKADHEIIDSKSFNSIKPLSYVPYPDKSNKQIFFTTSESTDLQSKVLEIVNNANKKIIISSFGWEENHPVVNKLCERAKEGVEVIVLARIRPAAMPALIQLANSGANVYGFKWLHAKAIWTDLKEALVMSANIENHGLNDGFEIGIYLTDKRQELVLNALQHWQEKSLHLLSNNPQMSDVFGDIKIWENNKFNDIAISKESTKSLGDFKVSNTQFLDKEQNLPALDWHDYPYHQVKLQWTNQAPAPEKNKKSKGVANE